MSHTPEPDRRGFLSRMAGAAVALATTACAAPLAAVSPAGTPMPNGTPPFDDTWSRRVQRARHRAVFDGPEVSGALALNQASLYLDNYKLMLGVSGPEIVPVVVMRHMGTVLAFNDFLWEKYKLGEFAKVTDPETDAPAIRNPVLHVIADQNKALVGANATLQALAARGAVLLACNRAAMSFATSQAAKQKRDVEEVRNEFRANMVPGVLLQPSGIYAVTRAQEVGAGFLRST